MAVTSTRWFAPGRARRSSCPLVTTVPPQSATRSGNPSCWKGRATEAALARAAADAIAELGLANVCVTDVAERAGVAPGHVTHYFYSKDELLMRAVTQIEDEDLERMRNEIHAIADPWERVMRPAGLVLANGPGDADWVVWFDAWSKAVRDELVAVQGAQMEATWRAEMADAVQSGMERGAFLVVTRTPPPSSSRV